MVLRVAQPCAVCLLVSCDLRCAQGLVCAARSTCLFPVSSPGGCAAR
ncbi:hypothetical protein A2U01_0068874, partial [Trifolium medium]|nr:hypothetical protein [Trifolium medium]